MQPAPAVELNHIARHFGDVIVLRGVSLAVRHGEFFSLLGPSGCGKTTLLRIIAGLDFPDSGDLKIGGKEALNLRAHERPVNTVFQSYALFPHLSVSENVAFGLRMKRVPREQIDQCARRIMELVRIADLASRKPAQLSGGQKQRVALARALVNEPQVLLLDEPLGALDLKLRKELQQELRALQRRTGITFIYVTHDQDEALSMSDRIAVMDHGAIVQLGSPAELYERPRTRFVAQFLGGCNLLRGAVCNGNHTDFAVRTKIGDVHVSGRPDGKNATHECTLAIRPERVLLGQKQTRNSFIAEIVETTYSGAETHCMVRIANELFRVAILNAATERRPSIGDSVFATLPAEALIILDD